MSTTQAQASTASLGKGGGKKDKKGDSSGKGPSSGTGSPSLEDLVVKTVEGLPIFSYVKAPPSEDERGDRWAMEDDVEVAPFGGKTLWDELVRHLPAAKAKRAVWMFEHLADLGSERSVDLQRHLLRVITPGPRPIVGDTSCDDITQYRRRDDSDVLGNNMAGFQNEGIDFALFGADIARSSSCCWEVVFPSDPTRQELLECLEKDSASHATFFRAYTAKGLPTRKFFYRNLGGAESSWTNETVPMTLGETSINAEFTWAPRCSVCFNLPSPVGHSHIQCPFVGTINKVRKQAKVRELVLEDGCWDRDDSPATRDFGHEMDEVFVLVKAIRADVDKLVKSSDKKRKSDSTPTQDKPAKKAKGVQAAGSKDAGPSKKDKGKDKK
ncbi:hypothetical protein PAXRUDRAFT_17385 [Paxillus rubicundulus Ve08.2h10]|uniref:Uncharacterized protein n=1 Tax=Paxillus rubicundulus Ve08.2h10 TaxID=930991 RepID=A0A0D0D218_9AGAM|nr:hypothetical protein PAXRUDRAFT_17385 [Paxillus rubicundulus Ve08.2h10]